MVILNFVLALVWMALNSAFTPVDFVVGFIIGFLIIILTQRALGARGYGTAVWRVIKLIAFTFWSIIKSNIAVAKVVLSPRMKVRPGILAVPLDSCSDIGTTVLANLITLTPGTLTLEVSSDKCILYIHFMNVDDPDALRREIKNDFERWVMEVFG